MALFHFVTDFQVDASPDRVWSVLENPSTWAAFWRWLRRVEVIRPGEPDGVGARYRFAFGTALRFTLEFDVETVRIVPGSFVAARAMGALAGTGTWEVSRWDGGSRVRCTWIVASTQRWMTLLAPIARSAFSWNHKVLMRDFATGLAGDLHAQLVSLDNRMINPGAPGFGQPPGPSASPPGTAS